MASAGGKVVCKNGHKKTAFGFWTKNMDKNSVQGIINNFFLFIYWEQ
jgi:hypothetical protein